MMKPTLLPFFDNIAFLAVNHESVILPSPEFTQEFNICAKFISCYTGSLGTFNSYRRETERLLQWTWRIKKCRLTAVKREDIENYLHFCQNPPKSWISLKKVPRYLEKDGKRQPNPEWRPFVARIAKASCKQGNLPLKEDFKLSQGAIQEIFAILSTFFNFLIAEEYLHANPIALIRQKSKFIRKTQQSAPVRRLSLVQWQAVIESAEELALKNPIMHERSLFILSLLFGMYLRISELAASTRWTPSMNHFTKDSNGCWWFTTVGKGNKERQIAVSPAMLDSLKRWRCFLGLSPLPSVADNSPLIPRIRGQGPMCDTAPLRRIVQKCFDAGSEKLLRQNLLEEADGLTVATVHWLRHTGISEDVRIRPREHVREDAGHSSSATTERYIDVEKQARYDSAQGKQIPGLLTHQD
jgi:integrase